MTSIETLMRDSNPMMDPSTEFSEEEMQAFDLLVRTRSGNMDVQELTKPVEPNRKPRGWMFAVAAAAVVIAIFGGVLLSARSTDAPPATVPPTSQAVTPTTVAEAEAPTSTLADLETTTTTLTSLDTAAVEFVEALAAQLNAGDFESIRDALDGAEVDSAFVLGARDAVARVFELWTYLDSEISVRGCKTLSWGATRCEIERTGPFEMFHPDVETTTIQVRLEDGRLAFINVDWVFTDPWGRSLEAFEDWLEERGSWTVVRDIRINENPVQTAELIKEYVPLWLATLDE